MLPALASNENYLVFGKYILRLRSDKNAMNRTLVLLSFVLLSFASVSSQTVITNDDLAVKVTKILLKRDLRGFADELAQTKGTRVDDLLVRLEVFDRAGRTDKVRETVVQLSEAVDLPPIAEQKWILEIVRRKIGQDLPALQIYYARLAEDDGYYETNPFISLWRSEGGEGLDDWLTKRAAYGTSWFTILLQQRTKLGTVQPIFDALADQVRQDPFNKEIRGRYLGYVKMAQEYRRQVEPRAFESETDWLGDVLVAQTAFDAYEYGQEIDPVNPRLAIKYYLESLSKPVTSNEIADLGQKHRTWASHGPQPIIDWEKQLRYWTKEKLAAAYQRTEQSILAQPLIEELAATTADDIMSRNDLRLAGAVQAGSGIRAIESKVLIDEATRSTSIEYWIERVDYYIGRGESELVIQAVREALPKVPAEQKQRFLSRFESVFDYPLSQDKQVVQLKSQISQILINEFNAAPIGSDLAFEIVGIASSEGFGLEDFMEAMFVRRSDVLTPLFDKQADWDGYTYWVLRYILRDERISPERKLFYFNELERMASRGSIRRKLVLEDVFKDVNENSRRIPLILDYLRLVKKTADNESSITNVLQSLFDAYTKVGNWQAAEKLLMERQPVFLLNLGSWLQRLAISAARQNDVDDALRIWLKAVNISGHARFGLINLAATPAKPILRKYYLEMKQRTPDSPEADEALKILR